ncbi:hypothetical protein X768_16720 [Mesorhizobium sp. LSJC265A00]|uniref:hypothetical protein n=1 Tax=Mesorhizobium sp. LSJC265A00 TaxID=1287322 RepID=UPI0003CDFDFB|nr:hypothetical protein [Mesorhizobium sp. LSJC265A00]ESX09981.1 hypothetical protein X768_16720 [Mesorhizobium sp. LSJC265A00]
MLEPFEWMGAVHQHAQIKYHGLPVAFSPKRDAKATISGDKAFKPGNDGLKKLNPSWRCAFVQKNLTERYVRISPRLRLRTWIEQRCAYSLSSFDLVS